MKTIKLFLFCVLAFTLASCSDDDFYDRGYNDHYLYEVESILAGREWMGDVGMGDEYGEPIYSVFYFGPDGRGEEYQYYKVDQMPYEHYTFRWYTEFCYDCGACSVVLDYGRGEISYMDDVHFSGPNFYGVFYLHRHSKGVEFKLRMTN